MDAGRRPCASGGARPAARPRRGACHGVRGFGDVHRQTAGNAALYGLADRGTLTAGLRADINVIDLDNLSVGPPRAHHDLPADGTRRMQPVVGYLATLVNGVATRRHDADTGERPGRLARSR